MLFADLSHSLNIDAVKRGVGRTFNPYHLGIGSDV